MRAFNQKITLSPFNCYKRIVLSTGKFCIWTMRSDVPKYRYNFHCATLKIVVLVKVVLTAKVLYQEFDLGIISKKYTFVHYYFYYGSYDATWCVDSEIWKYSVNQYVISKSQKLLSKIVLVHKFKFIAWYAVLHSFILRLLFLWNEKCQQNFFHRCVYKQPSIFIIYNRCRAHVDKDYFGLGKYSKSKVNLLWKCGRQLYVEYEQNALIVLKMNYCTFIPPRIINRAFADVRIHLSLLFFFATRKHSFTIPAFILNSEANRKRRRTRKLTKTDRCKSYSWRTHISARRQNELLKTAN